MGLISRVSSRTYRTIMRTRSKSARNAPPSPVQENKFVAPEVSIVSKIEPKKKDDNKMEENNLLTLSPPTSVDTTSKVSNSNASDSSDSYFINSTNQTEVHSIQDSNEPLDYDQALEKALSSSKTHSKSTKTQAGNKNPPGPKFVNESLQNFEKMKPPLMELYY